MNRWEDGTTPRYGWAWVLHFELPDQTAVCAMCGNARIKHVHNLRHPEGLALNVGACCAAQMLRAHPAEDYRDAIKELQSIERRHKRWLTRKWRLSIRGNYYLRDRKWTAFVYRVGLRWSVRLKPPEATREETLQCLDTFATIEEAKLSAFGEIEERRMKGKVHHGTTQ